MRYLLRPLSVAVLAVLAVPIVAAAGLQTPLSDDGEFHVDQKLARNTAAWTGACVVEHRANFTLSWAPLPGEFQMSFEETAEAFDVDTAPLPGGGYEPRPGYVGPGSCASIGALAPRLFLLPIDVRLPDKCSLGEGSFVTTLARRDDVVVLSPTSSVTIQSDGGRFVRSSGTLRYPISATFQAKLRDGEYYAIPRFGSIDTFGREETCESQVLVADIPIVEVQWGAGTSPPQQPTSGGQPDPAAPTPFPATAADDPESGAEEKDEEDDSRSLVEIAAALGALIAALGFAVAALSAFLAAGTLSISGGDEEDQISKLMRKLESGARALGETVLTGLGVLGQVLGTVVVIVGAALLLLWILAGLAALTNITAGLFLLLAALATLTIVTLAASVVLDLIWDVWNKR